MPAKRKSLQKPKAIDGHPAEPHTSAPSTIAVSKRINEPGNNCFAKADGENGNEQEAKAAINTAITIMRNYSISQADLMVREIAHQRENRGLLSTVDIWPPSLGGRKSYPDVGGRP